MKIAISIGKMLCYLYRKSDWWRNSYIKFENEKFTWCGWRDKSRPIDAGKKMCTVCEQKHAPVAFTIRNFVSSNRSRRCNNRARFGVDTKCVAPPLFIYLCAASATSQHSIVYSQPLHINLWQRLNDYFALRLCVWAMDAMHCYLLPKASVLAIHESQWRRAHELVRSWFRACCTRVGGSLSPGRFFPF